MFRNMVRAPKSFEDDILKAAEYFAGKESRKERVGMEIRLTVKKGWVAIDSDGEIWWYSAKPRIGRGLKYYDIGREGSKVESLGRVPGNEEWPKAMCFRVKKEGLLKIKFELE